MAVAAPATEAGAGAVGAGAVGAGAVGAGGRRLQAWEGAGQTTPSATFTTGGGFSERYQAPAWQAEAVDGYFATLGPDASTAGFNRTGRAYPDVAMVGSRLLVVLGGRVFFASGTSAATPIGMLQRDRPTYVRGARGDVVR